MVKKSVPCLEEHVKPSVPVDMNNDSCYWENYVPIIILTSSSNLDFALTVAEVRRQSLLGKMLKYIQVTYL